MALIQYLITAQDKALNALGLFYQQTQQRREEVIAEFELTDKATIETQLSHP